MDKPQATCPRCCQSLPADRHGSQKYCSDRCRKASEKHRAIERKRNPDARFIKCIGCGCPVDITEPRGGRKYCGDECRDSHRNADRRTAKRTCADAGCECKIRADNASGYCRDHRYQGYARSIVCIQCSETFHAARNRKVCDSCLACVDCGTVVLHASWTRGRRCSPCAQRRRSGLRLGRTLVRLRRSILKAEKPKKPRAKLSRHERECAHCGDTFASIQPQARYCSRRCKIRSASQRNNAVRRARRTGAYRENVYRARIAKRDGWRCGICGKPINPALKYPHLKSLSLDHIIPLARGGTHEPSNIQAAHFICNSIKCHTGESQMLLFG